MIEQAVGMRRDPPQPIVALCPGVILCAHKVSTSLFSGQISL
ncbi:MAG: hypothetical protein ACRYF7_17535 [Janthinobacterium lividum]